MTTKRYMAGKRSVQQAGELPVSHKGSVRGVHKAGTGKWSVATDQGIKTITTTPSSAAVMSDAARIYAGALKRLAKR